MVKDDPALKEEPELSTSVRMFNKMADKFDATNWPVEEDKLPIRERIRRLPKCMVRALPQAVIYVLAFQITLFLAQWAVEGAVPYEPFSWASIRSVVAWAVFSGFLIGEREATYAEGVFKPNFKELLKGFKANYIFLIIVVVILLPLNWEEFAGDAEIMWDSIGLLGLFSLVIASNEAKAWKKPATPNVSQQEGGAV